MAELLAEHGGHQIDCMGTEQCLLQTADGPPRPGLVHPLPRLARMLYPADVEGGRSSATRGGTRCAMPGSPPGAAPRSYALPRSRQLANMQLDPVQPTHDPRARMNSLSKTL